MLVNGQEVLSNYKTDDPLTEDDMKGMPEEEKKKVYEDDTIIGIRLDEY